MWRTTRFISWILLLLLPTVHSFNMMRPLITRTLRNTSHRRVCTRIFSTLPHETVTTEELFHNKPWVELSKQPAIEFSNTNEDALQINTKPKEGGNWNPENPLQWARDFGRRSAERTAALQSRIRLQPGDEGYFDVNHIRIPHVTIVRNRQDARIVTAKLMEATDIFHACDTEVMDIDLKTVGPVGNGYVTCVSIYSGPDFDYGLGDGPGSCLWIDNLDDACGVLQEFKEWFEDERFLKVWHNYGFDRHVMWNEGIDVKGFGGDTMHMARLENTARSRISMTGGTEMNGYSLEALTASLLNRRKQPMKEIFGVKRLRKDGSEGSIIDIPPVEVMQRDPRFRSRWILYSSYDAVGTYKLREVLEERLKKRKWLSDSDNMYDYYFMHMRPFGEVLTDMERRGIRVDARDYLAKAEQNARADRERHSRIFREWAATKIGVDGLAINTASSLQLCTFLFGGALNEKTNEFTESVRVFKVPREEIPEDALEAIENRDRKDDDEDQNNDLDYLEQMKATQLKALCKERGLKLSGKKAELIERLKAFFIHDSQRVDRLVNADEFDEMTDKDLQDVLIARGQGKVTGTRDELLKRIRQDVEFTNQILEASTGLDADGMPEIAKVMEDLARKDGGALAEALEELRLKSSTPPKNIDITIKGLGLKIEKYTAGNSPSVTADVIGKLAGDPFADPPKYGSAFEKLGKEGCEALASLAAIGSIDTMIANFFTSLQELVDDQSRVHCSLNLNTETGRLSSRRPNLQNQPALEKDKYKIRKAFQASPGNNLIVADYGQLELRLLASLTECTSMIEAFKAGGDFHSRTALDMFPYIQEKVKSGEVILEWDYADGEPTKPLVKDLYASERRKAKTLNFSIAYGKTAHGLSQDWGVSKEEAEEMLKAWYKARPEVEKWQKATQEHAKRFGETRTLMGRYRDLPHAMKGSAPKFLGHAMRASINTPIQGGAADVAMMAMIKINNSPKLKKLGWILLLQIHDEVILEGPEETAEEAFQEVLDCMQNPWVYGLKKTSVPLEVDGSYNHKTWYDAK
ncbi:DNA polymerase I [Fistulifera solaris]|uniref:DNA polymerase I n=1 Tax=Fistulifera solaris TaxID=1519565 RepID=A0A1Z5J7M8_FISSO|nr:DNA polymerase I [Fistulifera solaris]|eukprot:GAX09828.1 DNA polymerase I [Fistulifera solaris]